MVAYRKSPEYHCRECGSDEWVSVDAVQKCARCRNMTTTTPVIPPAVQAAMLAKRADATDRVAVYEAFEVVTPEDYAMVSEEVVAVKIIAKEVSAAKRGLVDPINASLAAIRDWFRPAETLLERCESVLKGKINGYNARLRAQNDAAIAEVQIAVEAGDPVAASEALTAMVPAPAKAEGVSVSEVWDWKVCNSGIVPDDYKEVVPAKVRAEMKRQLADGLTPVIPGITFFKTSRVAVRT